MVEMHLYQVHNNVEVAPEGPVSSAASCVNVEKEASPCPMSPGRIPGRGTWDILIYLVTCALTVIGVDTQLLVSSASDTTLKSSAQKMRW